MRPGVRLVSVRPRQGQSTAGRHRPTARSASLRRGGHVSRLEVRLTRGAAARLWSRSRRRRGRRPAPELSSASSGVQADRREVVAPGCRPPRRFPGCRHASRGRARFFMLALAGASRWATRPGSGQRPMPRPGRWALLTRLRSQSGEDSVCCLKTASCWRLGIPGVGCDGVSRRFAPLRTEASRAWRGQAACARARGVQS
jgi:hypothetical protein